MRYVYRSFTWLQFPGVAILNSDVFLLKYAHTKAMDDPATETIDLIR